MTFLHPAFRLPRAKNFLSISSPQHTAVNAVLLFWGAVAFFISTEK